MVLIAASVERSLMLDVLRDLEKQTGKEISNMNFALGNIFRYLEYLQVSLHQNDLEKDLSYHYSCDLNDSTNQITCWILIQ